MAGDVQLDEPAARLLRAATTAVPAWLRRVTSEAAARSDVGDAVFADELSDAVTDAGDEALERLAELLAIDVDAQRTTPLSICRDAVRAPTAVLRRHGVAPAVRSASSGRADDPYELEPAAWSDIDPAMHEPGLAWGAWKAMTILQRRRDDGLR